MPEDEEKRLRRLISEAEAGVGQDADPAPASPAEAWLRLWWQTLRSVLPAPRT